jgi:hypothetical protein
MAILSNISAIIMHAFPMILKEPLSVISEPFLSTLMIPPLGNLSAIYLTKLGRTLCSFHYAFKLLKPRPGLSGLSADWVSSSFIKTNGLKLFKAFNMPYEAILLVLICGK